MELTKMREATIDIQEADADVTLLVCDVMWTMIAVLTCDTELAASSSLRNW